MIIITSVLLDSELKTKKHVESLAFNRGASTIGETKAISYIERELSSVNLESHYQYFHWTGPTRVLMRVSYLVVVTYLLLSRLFLLLIAYIVIKLSFERTRQLSLIKKDSSKNIYTKILAKNQQNKRPVVIFSAHYDSISANISYRVQVLMFLIYRLIIGFYVCIIFILSIWLTLDIFYIYSLPTNIVILVSILSLFGIVTSIPILYLVFNEKPSSCSIDNASGVAILIELAKLFKKNPLENMDLYFIWTGAEEWGLKGSKTFCADNIIYLNEEYDLDKSINVNIDMVGTYIGLLDKVGLPLRRRLNKNVNNILEATANSLNIPITRFNKIIEPKSDHIVFRRCAKRARKNIQVVFFHSDKDSKYIHSLRDTPDKCKSENLNGCLAICYQALKSIDSRIE
ncbi:MAG: M28 family metallopeptidase [Candidatus Thorarchaeota archaeon]